MIIKKGSLHNRGSNIIEELKDGRKYEETNISVKNKRMRRGETNKERINEGEIYWNKKIRWERKGKQDKEEEEEEGKVKKLRSLCKQQKRYLSSFKRICHGSTLVYLHFYSWSDMFVLTWAHDAAFFVCLLRGIVWCRVLSSMLCLLLGKKGQFERKNKN